MTIVFGKFKVQFERLAIRCSFPNPSRGLNTAMILHCLRRIRLLLCVVALYLAQSASLAGPFEISIAGSRVYADGREVPFGRHSDSVYDSLFGAHSFKSNKAALFWADKGIVIERRTMPSDNCAVIFTVYLRPDPHRVVSADFSRVGIAAFPGRVTVEGAPIRTQDLPRLRAATKGWAVVSPFGYAYSPPSRPAVHVLAFLDHGWQGPRIEFMQVVIEDYESICAR
jgi:hypothetical protein